MVDEDNMNPAALAAAQAGQVPFGDEFYIERNGQPLLVRKQVVLTGDRLTDAQPGFDNQSKNRPSTSRSTRPARESSRNTRARTSASGWRSSSSKRPGAKSSPRP